MLRDAKFPRKMVGWHKGFRDSSDTAWAVRDVKDYVTSQTIKRSSVKA